MQAIIYILKIHSYYLKILQIVLHVQPNDINYYLFKKYFCRLNVDCCLNFINLFNFRDFSVTKFFSKERSNLREKMNEMLPVESNVKPINEQLSLLKMHPGHVKFSDLAQKMKPMSVEGLEYITGVLGYIEDAPPKSADSDDEVQRNTGKPSNGALLWAHIALYSDGNPRHFDCSLCRGDPHVML